MLDPFWILVAVIALALVFNFTNGWHDTANAIATVVGTRTLSPWMAILLAAVLNLAGAFFSTEVAKAIGEDIVNIHYVTLIVLLSALIAVIVWNVITVLMGLPTSSSHALIGSIIGAALAYKGPSILQYHGIITILIAMLISPVLGGIVSAAIIKLIRGFFSNIPRSRVKTIFKYLQILSSAFMAFSHGASDAQKAMGVIGMALFAFGSHSQFTVPWWATAASALIMGVGTAAGGRKVIHTIGSRLSRLETPQGFAAETGAAFLLTTVAKIGVPVSTTHTITGSIIGVGAAERLRSVRWSVAGKIIYAWVLTLPGTAVMSYLLYMALKFLEP
ncbi:MULTISPECIES: inorganic phosphate transporter [unclassified Thermoactinomyces]|jgi:inorganic phosphate transporter, PiT family|uniref:inorganic phosphate transporter n=1 Tax=unclassified Thermoactinomyces TaxID=2634588 RepID=UPI0018DB80DD|nr:MULTISPECIES: inorganic phosphate transporter [unclassified Thermoactinomyces]MBH8597053.1 inorganic phosphate transporter [Thermoactinomyces sp. CICC 10523]MBH8602612.1 inorganic phosphate transporter [Thermoactinomyces sp. CICC 10522]MBH8606276.1 inorganic phosphate transporter [Thermoactinomyces sp. CICC 10521]